MFLGAVGLLVAAWLARTPRRQGGTANLRIPLQDPPVLEVEPGDAASTEEARTALLADPRRLTSVLVGHGAYRPVMAILVLVVSLWALVGAALGGYLA